MTTADSQPIATQSKLDLNYVPTPFDKITVHNRDLLKKVAQSTRTFSRYPKVSEQVECLPLETSKLFANGYNPTLNEKGWMVYRFHKGNSRTKLAVAQIGKEGQVLSNKELIIGPPGEQSEEDARLFTHMGADCLIWVESKIPKEIRPDTKLSDIKSVVKYATFEDMRTGKVFQPLLLGNDWSGIQKNWVAFGHNGDMMLIYQCHPTHVVYRALEPDFRTFQIYETEGPRWAYGEIRGGTPPIPYDGKLLRFFHSRLNNEIIGRYRHRYFVGAMLLKPEPPFEVVRVSKRPVIFGSEISDIPTKERPKRYKDNVVFVAGAVEANGAWTVAVGENDSRCLLCRIKPEQLNL